MKGLALALRIARRYLFRRSGGNRRRTISAIAGIALSIVPLVLVLEMADGMIKGITSRYVEAGTYHLQAYPNRSMELEKLQEQADRLRGVEGVRSVNVEHRGVGLLSSAEGRSGVEVRAVPPEIVERDDGFRRYVKVDAGSFDLSSPRQIVLGRYLADRLAVAPGDEVRLLTVRSLEGGSFLPRVSRFTVSGIVSTGYQELDRLWAFLPLERGFAVLPPENADSYVGVKIEHPYALHPSLFGSPLPSLRDHRAEKNARATVARVVESLGFDWRVYSWYNLERSRYISFQTSRNLLLFIMTLIVIVAAVNVSSTLVMLVVEKEQEIAFLRTLGASPNLIQQLFLAAGAIIGVAGTGVGMVVATALAINLNELLLALEGLVNAAAQLVRQVAEPFTQLPPEQIVLFSEEFYLERVPISLDPLELSLLAAAAMALSLLAAVVPARRSVRLYPLDLLRRH